MLYSARRCKTLLIIFSHFFSRSSSLLSRHSRCPRLRHPPPRPRPANELQLPAALNRVLGDSIHVTPDNMLSRTVTGKRKYVTTRVAQQKQPARALKVVSVESIRDGSCFPVRKTDQPGQTPLCCGHGCNTTFGTKEHAIDRVRAEVVPPAGNGQQKARKLYVRGCIQKDKTLMLNDRHGNSAVVCQKFFVAVTGCSKKLIQSAMEIGGAGM